MDNASMPQRTQSGIWVDGTRACQVRYAGLTALVLLILVSPTPAATPTPAAPSVTVAAGSGNTKAYLAPNGATVVNINTANPAGLSVNYYKQYNVGSTGLILNNDTSSQITVQTQLGGQLFANLNLANPASIILNEVVGSNRSNLAGFTEVAGSKADVIVANPYGITCAGCGFINTDRATLTTGLPVIAGNGTLTGFNVQQGDVLVSGEGLNASNQATLDLVTRSVELQGPINAQDLGIVTGLNTWNYTNRTASGSTSGTGAPPAYAIDSSLVGGMYANRIKLIATENGVGVRMLGNVAANSGDFTLTAAGTIVLQAPVSAGGNLSVSTSSTDPQALQLTDTSYTAAQNLSLVSGGGLILNGGALVAGQNLSITAAGLVDSAGSAALQNENQRVGNSGVSINVAGAATLDDTTWQADSGSWAGQFGSLTIGADGTRLLSGGALSAIANGGDLALATAHVQSAGDLTLTAGKGAISTAAASSQLVESSVGNLNITAGTGLDNNGIFAADKAAATFSIGGTLANGGTIQAATALTVNDAEGGGGEAIVNNGYLLSGGMLAVQAASISNAPNATIQAAAGSTVQVGSLGNAGTWLTSLPAPADANDSIAASGTFSNSGVFQSGGNLTITAGSLTNSSSLTAIGNLQLDLGASGASLYNSGTIQAGAVPQGGTVQAGATLGINAPGLVLTNPANARLLGDALDFALGGLTNNGIIQGGGSANSSITASGTLDNQAGATLTLATAGTGSGTASAARISNEGTLQSSGSMTLLAGNDFADSNAVLANGAISIGSSNGSSYTAEINGNLQSGGSLSMINASTIALGGAGAIQGNTVTLGSTGSPIGTLSLAASGAGAVVSSLGNMDISVDSLNLDSSGSSTRLLGGLGGSGTFTLDVLGSGPLVNNGTIYSKGNLTINAPGVVNPVPGQLIALNTLQLDTSGNVTNSGFIWGGNGLDVGSSGAAVATLTNVGTVSNPVGNIQSDGAISVYANDIENNSIIHTTGSIYLHAPTITNEVAGGDTIQSATYQNLNITNNLNTNTGTSGATPPSTCPGYAGCSYSFPDAYWSATYTETFDIPETFTGPKPTFKPQIIADGNGSNVTLAGFNTASNTGAIISASNQITLDGNGGSSIFTNTDLFLIDTTYTYTWDWNVHYAALGPSQYSNNDYVNLRLVSAVPTLMPGSDTGSGVFASVGAIQGSGFAFINDGNTITSPQAITAPQQGTVQLPGTKTGPGTTQVSGAIGGNTVLTAAGFANLAAITITVPTSTYGEFVLDQSPGAQYLIETNPLLDTGSNYVGATFLESELGINPDGSEKLVGDNNYQAYLVEQELIAQTGNNLLNSYASLAQEMQGLETAAASESQSLDLDFGKPLTAEQQADLTQDMVWMVSTVIDDQTVLAPVVYLSPATRAGIASGAVVRASSIDLDVTSLSNNGGTIEAAGTMNVVAQDSIVNTRGTISASTMNLDAGSLANNGGSIQAGGTMTAVAKSDIVNDSGTISANNMALVSTDGLVINETSASRQGDSTNYQDVAGASGTISAKSNLLLSGDKGVDILGSTVNAGDAATIYSAIGNINVQSQALTSQTTTQSSSSSLFSSSSTKTVTSTQTEQTAAINVGGNGNSNAQLTLVAGKGDVNLTSAQLNSSGGINIAANNVNSRALDLTKSTSTTTSSSGISVSGGALSIGSSSSSSQQSVTTASGSSIKAGGALNVDAQNNIVLQGGSYSGQTVSLAAGNNVITQAAGNSYSYSSSSSSAGLTVGNGSLSAGASNANANGSGTNYGNAQITGANGVSVTAVNKVDIGGADMSVLNAATPAPSTSTASDGSGAGSSGSSTPSPLGNVAAPPVVTARLDVAALQTAAVNGTAGSFIANAASSGLDAAAQMSSMPQAAQGQLNISGGQIVSTKFENTAQQSSSSSSAMVGIGTSATSSATGASAGITLSAGTSSQSASSSSQNDNINHLSGDNVSLQGSNSIDLKGVAISGSSGVTLQSNGDINVTAASSHKESSSSSQSVGVSVGVSANANISGQPASPLTPLPAEPASITARLSIGAQSSTAQSSADTHTDSTLSSNGAINVESGQGNVTWTGVTTNADTVNVTGKNFTSAAYQDSASSSISKTSLGVNLATSTDPTQSLSSLLNGNGISNSTDVKQQTAQVGNTISANNLNVDVTNNVTLVGGNISAGNANIQANTVDIQAAKSTYEDHSTSASVSLGASGSATFSGNTASGSIDSLQGASSNVGATNNGSNAGSSYANNSTGASGAGVNGQVGLTINTDDTTTKSTDYSNANLNFNNLSINTTAPAGSGAGDGHVDIGGANLQGNSANSSINIATGELDSTKYTSSTETTRHSNTTFAGVTVEGDSAIADTASNSTALANSAHNGMSVDSGLAAGQSIADVSNLAMGNVVGGSVAAAINNTDVQSNSLSTAQNTTYVDAGTINITTTKGNINLNGVQFSAPPGSNTGTSTGAGQPHEVTLNSAGDVNITAAKSTLTETSTTLQNSANVTGGAAISGAGSGASVQAGYNGSIEQDSLASTTYANSSISGSKVSITAQNLNMAGANVSGGNVDVNVAHDINISSVQNTQQQSTSKANWGASAGLDTTTIVAVNGQGGGGSSHDNYALTGKQAGISASNNLDITTGGNLTMAGAQLASAGGGNVNVKGNVTANQLNDYQDQNGLFVGVSGGIGNEGKFASGGVNVQQVDQIHTATTQNSTISGVGLSVGGSLQGNNLTASGGLQTQAQTVTENQHIAGASIDATVGYTPKKSSKPDSLVVVMTHDGSGHVDPTVRQAAESLAKSHPNAVIVTAAKDGSSIDDAGALSSVKGNTHVAVVGHGGDLRKQGADKVSSLVTDIAGKVEGNGKGTTVKQVEIVACGTCTKDGDQTFGQQVATSMGRAGTKVVEHDSSIQVLDDGSRVAQAGKGAKTLTSTYSKDRGVKTEATTKGKSELVAQLDPGQTLMKRRRTGVATGVIVADHEEAAAVDGAHHEQAMAPPVAAGDDEHGDVEHLPPADPPVAANDDGDVIMHDAPAEHDALAVQGVPVVHVAEEVAAHMPPAAAHADDDHMSVDGSADGSDIEGGGADSGSAAKPVAHCSGDSCQVITPDSKGIPVAFRKAALKQGVITGDAEGGHQYSTMPMTQEQYADFKKATGVTGPERDFSVGDGRMAKVALTRRGSFVGSVDDGSGKLAVFRMSSHLSTGATKAANDDDITVDRLRADGTLGATSVDKRPNVVTGTAVTLAYNPVKKTVDVKDGLYAQGISGTGVKTITAPGAKTTKEAKEYAYAPSRNSADQAAESGVAQEAAVYHSEPMAITKMNDAAHEAGVPDLLQEPHLVLFTSVPRQACDNCGHALAESNNKDSLVSVESAEPFMHYKPGEVGFKEGYTVSKGADVPPVVGGNVARVVKGVPHENALKEDADAQQQVAEVKAIRDFHLKAEQTATPDSLVVVMTHDGSGRVDDTVRQAADNLRKSHPNAIIVMADKDGTGISKEDADKLAAVSGRTHIALVGHGTTLRGQTADKATTLVKSVVSKIDGNDNDTDIKQVEVVACGTCTKAGEKTFGQQLAGGLQRKDLAVVEHDSNIQVQDSGARVAEAGRNAKTLSSTYSDGGVRTQSRIKGGDELVPALESARTLNGDLPPAKKAKPADDHDANAMELDEQSPPHQQAAVYLAPAVVQQNGTALIGEMPATAITIVPGHVTGITATTPLTPAASTVKVTLPADPHAADVDTDTGSTATASAAAATKTPSLPASFDPDMPQYRVIGKADDVVYEPDATGVFAASNLRDDPKTYGKLEEISKRTGQSIEAAIAKTSPAEQQAAAKRLMKMAEILSTLGEGGNILPKGHLAEAEDFAEKLSTLGTAYKKDAKSHRENAPYTDETVSTATTLNMLRSYFGAAKGKDEKSVGKAALVFLSSIRQPTLNVQARARQPGGANTEGVLHPNGGKFKAAAGDTSGASEHSYADRIRADAFLETVSQTMADGRSVDQAIMLGAAKAIQHTLAIMEFPYTASNVDASGHSATFRTTQMQQREILKEQLDVILGQFGVKPPSGTQDADAPVANKGLPRTRSESRIIKQSGDAGGAAKPAASDSTGLYRWSSAFSRLAA